LTLDHVTTGQAPPPPRPSLHQVENQAHWPWLPKDGVGVLAPHPYCRDCGLVKFVGAARALDGGGLSNLLAKLSRRLHDVGIRTTEAQRRLIMLRLLDRQADDAFGMSRAAQDRILAEIVGKHLAVPPDVVRSYLHSC